MTRFRAGVLGLWLGCSLTGIALAQDAVPDAAAAAPAEAPAADQPPPTGELPPPIYDDKLLRLSEILGSLSFLRDLCGEADGPAWRDEMTALLDAENPAASRRTRLIARFNHGFETFNAVYRTCTPAAKLSIARYLSEGETLAADVRSRYSQ